MPALPHIAYLQRRLNAEREKKEGEIRLPAYHHHARPGQTENEEGTRNRVCFGRWQVVAGRQAWNWALHGMEDGRRYAWRVWFHALCVCGA